MLAREYDDRRPQKNYQNDWGPREKSTLGLGTAGKAGDISVSNPIREETPDLSARLNNQSNEISRRLEYLNGLLEERLFPVLLAGKHPSGPDASNVKSSEYFPPLFDEMFASLNQISINIDYLEQIIEKIKV